MVEPTIPALLAAHATDTPDVEAVVGDDRSVTYAQLDEETFALARRLVAAGVGPGDRVGLLAPNGVEWATVAYAVMRVGATLVPLSTLLRPPELIAQLETAAVSQLIATDEYRGRRYPDELDGELPGITTVDPADRLAALPSLRAVWSLAGLPEPQASEALVRALEERVCPAHDLAIMFTSGSRGRPKGVIHTHGNALRATASGLEARQVLAGERLYLPMPFFWMGGFGGGLLSALVSGATLLTESSPEPARTLEFIQRRRVTLFRGWPDQAKRIAAQPGFADADLSALRPASLGALLPPDQRPAPGARANLFGMTESFGPYCGARLDLDLPAEKWGSCGKPFEGVEVRIVDPDSGEPVAVGADGEISLRGPNMMRGICGRLRSEVFTVDGFYRTGDLGRLDADGYLWYSGRVDDMFKVKGATVYPSEVEAALRAIPAVTVAHVTDVDDGEGHHQVAALVVSDASLDELVAAVKGRLSAFKVPTRWLVVDDQAAVPTIASGKVDKAALQKMLAGQGSSTPK